MSQKKAQSVEEHPSVTFFRDFLKINTMHPDPDYGPCIAWLRKAAKELGLGCDELETCPNNSMFWMTWEGTQPELPSVMVYCHMDVVPVYPDKWTYPPFSAHKDEKGDIYARGSQDMKCVGIWYIEAIRRLKKAGERFPRTIHVVFGPDEELGGQKGMGIFIKSPEFKALNVGFALDEGIANPGEEMRVFYGERLVWWIEVRCGGMPGHGSQFIKDTAGEKMRRVINSFMAFRDSEEKRLKDDSSLNLGDVTTVNFNMTRGGVQPNVVPSELFATFDMRIAPTVDLKEHEKMIDGWLSAAGPDVTCTYIQKKQGNKLTSIDPSDKWWSAFKAGCDDEKLKIKTEIFPAATDSTFVRQIADLPALGFSPMNNTPILLHDHDEFLNEDIFLRGIEIYCSILPRLLRVPE